MASSGEAAQYETRLQSAGGFSAMKRRWTAQGMSEQKVGYINAQGTRLQQGIGEESRSLARLVDVITPRFTSVPQNQ